MKIFRMVAGLSLSVLLGMPAVAQQTNEQTRKDVKAQAKQQEQADKAQAKADKSEKKAAGSRKVKKAVRDQDKANAAQPQ